MNKVFALFVLFACCVFAAEPIEDWSAQKGDVVHFGSEKEFKKFIKKNEDTLVMFYAPWCGHCKTLKPLFSEAATKVKSDKKAAGDKKGAGHYGAVDCTKLADLCQTYDVKGYPTLKMFSKEGETVTDYQRPRSLFELTKFVRPESATEAPAATGDAAATPSPKKPEGDDWSSTPSDVNHLTEETFDKFLADNDKVLVMFYAPWCGHCKNFKPAYTEAAAEVKKAGNGALAAVDCTQHEKVCSKFDVRGYPTVKYFNKGNVQADYSRPRSRDDVVKFMASPPAENEKPTPRSEEKKPAPAADDWSNTPSDVNHLTDDSFDRFLADNEKTLVMFYAPWCGHCKNFKPAYTEAAAEVKKAGSGALAAVDCTQNDKVCQKFEVRGYPTIKYFNKGKVVADYARQRSKEEVVKFMAAPPTENEKPAPQVGGDAPNADDWSSVPSDVVHLDEAKFDAYVSANSPVLIMFYAPWCGHCKTLKPIYTEAAEVVKSSGKGSLAAVDCTKSQNLCQKYAVRSYPTVKYFKNGQDFIDFSGQRTKDGIVNFMGREPEAPWKSTPSDVIHATDADFDTLLQTKAPALVMFYAPWCGHCKSFKPAFQEAATTVKNAGTGNLIAVDCTREKQTCNKQEVKSYPTIKYFTSASESVPFEAERNAASVVAYMASGGKNVPAAAAAAAAAAPKVQEEKKAADVWTDAGSEHVTHLNGETFADHIANNPEAVVMFYAPWCGHCKKMKPAYSEAASKLTTDGHKGSLAAVDCTVHPELCQKYGVRGYPTLKHFSKGQLTEEKVGRATDDLYDFIKGKVTIAVDAAKDIVNDAKDAAIDAKDVIIDVAKDAKQAVQNRVDEAKDIAKEKVDAVKDAAKAAVEDAKAKMDDVKGGVKAAVEDAKAKVEDVKDAAKDQAKKVKKAVQDAKEDL